ncbi:MAG: hypothetical protein U1E65_30980 [Myxococcota bacterium]
MTRATASYVALLVAAGLSACSSASQGTDAGASADASNADASTADSGASDSGLADAGPADTGAPTPRLEVLDVERPVAVSGDGKTILVWQQSTGALLFYDVETRQLSPKTTLDPAGIQTEQPMAVSSSRRIAASYGFQPTEAALWDEASGWHKLGSPFPGCVDTSTAPPIPQDRGTAFDLSEDGHVAVGLLWQDCNTVQAFRWSDATSTGTFQLLDRIGLGPDMQGPSNNRATVVSSDGRIAAGWAYNVVADRSPAIWRADGTGFLLDPTDTMNPGEITAISRDGSIAAGFWARPTGGLDGFVWDQAGGVHRFSKADMADQSSLFVTAISADGTWVFGRDRYQLSFFDPADDNAFVWSQAKGLRKIADIAAAHGLMPAADLRLASVHAASDDGLVLVGEAQLPPLPNDPNMMPVLKVYVLVLPPGAY